MANKSTKESLSKKSEADLAKMAKDRWNLILNPEQMQKDEMIDIMLDVQDNGTEKYPQYLPGAQKAVGDSAQTENPPPDNDPDDEDLPEITGDGIEEEPNNVGHPHAAKAAEAGTPARENDIRRAPRKRIIIHKDKDPGGDRDVPLSINGFAILIKRGVEVAVPEPFLHLLNNTMQTVYERNDDTGEQEARDVPRFNVQYVGDA